MRLFYHSPSSYQSYITSIVYMGFDTAGSSFAFADSKAWLREVLKENSPLVMSTLWWVWRLRNVWCMEGKLIPWQVLRGDILAMFDDIARCYAVDVDAPMHTPRLVRWTVGLADCVVLNVDGSVHGTPQRGGFGGCFRTIHGNWLRGFFGYLDECCILHLELLGMFHGLSLAWEQGYRIVECQSDSQDAVTLVKSTPSSCHRYAALVWDIKDLQSRDWIVELRHTLREGNACADLLAKHGADQNDDLVITENPIAGLGVLLLADACGVSFVRP
ncbi:uncharacterized protein LOC130732747 [Lotus japonicus]|uniref:uncharacterized protein LOC130732747 n=1 Tax=Lotus japonicus TaxID=34305 RepID=UPI00258658C6|nr:uncharacterized protein LOC130732747 [Lotus japonicus]